MFKKFIMDKKVVSIYENCDDLSSCSVGVIQHETDEYIKVKSISPEGTVHGYEIININAICKIDYDGIFEQKIQFLHDNKNEIFQKHDLDYTVGNDLILSTLEAAKENQCVVVIWLNDESDSIIGFVKEIDNKIININILDDYGRKDGSSIFLMTDIKRVDFSSKKAQIIQFLYQKSFTRSISCIDNRVPLQV